MELGPLSPSSSLNGQERLLCCTWEYLICFHKPEVLFRHLDGCTWPAGLGRSFYSGASTRRGLALGSVRTVVLRASVTATRKSPEASSMWL